MRLSANAKKLSVYILSAMGFIVIASTVAKFVNDLPKTAKFKQNIQVINVIPPPPPPVIEKPKELEMEEKIEIPEQEEVPEPVAELAESELPPGDQLGLDAEGAGLGDEFGLIGRKGGKDLLSTGGSFDAYSHILKSEIHDKLLSYPDIRKKKYSADVKLWISREGKVSKAELAKSTGDRVIDRSLKAALSAMASFADKPPEGMPQPIQLRIYSRI